MSPEFIAIQPLFLFVSIVLIILTLISIIGYAWLFGWWGK